MLNTFKYVQCPKALRTWTNMDIWKILVCHTSMPYVSGFVRNTVDIQALSSLTQDATLQQLAFTWPVKMDGVILILTTEKVRFTLVSEGSRRNPLRGKTRFLKSKCLFTLSSSEICKDQEGNNCRITPEYF